MRATATPPVEGKGYAGPLSRSPMLVGASRKRFLGHLTGQVPAAARDYATSSACAMAIERGAKAIRVHNVRAGHDTARVADAIKAARLADSTAIL
jgi:dihydropteroate synthase